MGKQIMVDPYDGIDKEQTKNLLNNKDESQKSLC